uniref:Inhibin-1 n=1 Tax=Schmidtea mediterranea TaxID=79327 RepID=I1ZI68_SCHMD|nr:inhibin-1 [Schmidtea mediterranea]
MFVSELESLFIMKRNTILLVIIFQVFQIETNPNNKYALDLMKRENALKKFEEQLLSSLHFKRIPLSKIGKSPKKIWLQLPFEVRKRMESVKLNHEKSLLETKELYVPVNILKNCHSNMTTDRFVCIEFHLGYHKPISAAMIYLNLPNLLSNLSQYEIRMKSSQSNATVTFIQQEANLFSANIISILNTSSDVFSSNVQQYEIVCRRECDDRPFDNIKMFLEVVLNHKPSLMRNRRSTNQQKSCTSKGVFCCKRNFKFRPVDLGWNWIVYPEEIVLNYCSGECNQYISSNNYGKMISFIRRTKPHLSPLQVKSMRSCCAPEDYNGLELIYMPIRSNTFQKMYLPNILINNCSCI